MKIGAYAVEQDFSHYVAYTAKTIFAVVGTATKGPIGVPTVCTSAQDLANKFGPLNPSCYGLYAGQQFLSQSTKLYFVRAAHDDATEATATIAGVDASDTDVADAIVLKALEKGTYADSYKVTISGTGASVDTFNMTIKNAAGAVLETVKNIKFEDLEAGYKTAHVQVSSIGNAVKVTPGDYTFTGGNDGITNIEDDDYITAGNTLAAETIDMNLFAIPGVTSNPVIIAMLALAETRGDTFFLVDAPKGLTKTGIIDWHNATGDYQSDTNIQLDSSYGALYYDWVTIYDPINKAKVEVPPSVVVAATYAYSDRTTEPWYAPAGLNRGVVRGVLDSVTKLSKIDVETLYSDPNNINCIYDDPQVGLVLWGQKTLSRETSALNRVNVRRLLNYLKRVITAACNYLTFDANDRITWNLFEMMVLPILNNVKEKRGLYAFEIHKGESIVTDEDIDNYRMPCRIMIQPTKAAEEIPIYFSITSTGADFGAVVETM